MTIEIVDGPKIRITRAEYELLYQEWKKSQMYTTQPRSFETWLQARRSQSTSARESLAAV